MRLLAASACLVALCAAHAGPSVAATAFVDVTVLSMTDGSARQHRTVLVEGKSIIAIGPRSAVHIPIGATRVDGRGKFLMPGLADMHVHLATKAELALYVAHGVTTVFNLNGRPAHLRWRAAAESGVLLAPRILSTGPLMNEARTAAQSVAEVDRVAAAGYDGVKVYNGVSAAEYGPLVREARRLGLLLVGHVAREPGFEATLAARQSIAHAEEIVYTAFNSERNDRFDTIRLDESRLPAVARQVRDAGVFVTPTLACFHDILRQASELDAFLAAPQLKQLAPWIRAGLEPPVNRYHDRYSPRDLAFLGAAYPFQQRLVKALAQAGVRLLAGTDATLIGPVAGFALHEELEELVRAGLTPVQALRAATVNAAAFLKRPGETGQVTVGSRADLLLLGADPRRDIRHTRRIEGVMVAGRYHDRAALAASVAALPGAYEATRRSVAQALVAQPGSVDGLLDEEDPLDMLGADVLASVARERGQAGAMRVLEEASAAGSRLAGEELVNNAGYVLLGQSELALAVALLRFNTARHPDSANAHDSLADAYARSGETARARESYGRALQIDPAYINADGARRYLAATAP